MIGAPPPPPEGEHYYGPPSVDQLGGSLVTDPVVVDLNPSALTDGDNNGTSIIKVQSTKPFSVGCFVQLFAPSGPFAGGAGPYQVVAIAAGSSITLPGALLGDLPPGSYVVRVPVVTLPAGPLSVTLPAGVKNTLSSISVVEAQDKTYTATINLALAAGATDVFQLRGNNTHVARVIRFRLSIVGPVAAAGYALMTLLKRGGGGDTGGTSSSVVPTPHDSNDPAATSVVTAWTANPAALGSSLGLIKVGRLFVADVASTTVQPLDQRQWEWGTGPGEKPIKLINSLEALCLNGGPAAAGAVAAIEVTFTEE